MAKQPKTEDPTEPKERVAGVVVKLVMEKGFGFIRDASGTEYFFHRSALRPAASRFETLVLDQTVTFEITSGQRGLRAEQIHLME